MTYPDLLALCGNVQEASREDLESWLVKIESEQRSPHIQAGWISREAALTARKRQLEQELWRRDRLHPFPSAELYSPLTLWLARPFLALQRKLQGVMARVFEGVQE